MEHEEELLSETVPSVSSSIDASAAEEGEPESREELHDSEEIPESSVELEDDEADLMLFDELEDDEEVSNEFSVEEESIEVDIFEEMAPQKRVTLETPAADSNDEEDGWDQEKKRQFSEFADLLDELEAQVADATWVWRRSPIVGIYCVCSEHPCLRSTPSSWSCCSKNSFLPFATSPVWSFY